MIIDALRFRVKWPEIEQGVYFHSPALRRIAKSWMTRVGLRYKNAKMEEMNHKRIQVKLRKAEKIQGRVRRNAISRTDYFPSEELEKFIKTRKLDGVVDPTSSMNHF